MKKILHTIYSGPWYKKILVWLLTLLLLSAMLSWSRAEEIERRFSARLPLGDYLSQLQELRADTGVLKLADNLIYLDGGKEGVFVRTEDQFCKANRMIMTTGVI